MPGSQEIDGLAHERRLAVAGEMPGATQGEREAQAELLYSSLVGIITLARLAGTAAERRAYVDRSRVQLLRLMGEE